MLFFSTDFHNGLFVRQEYVDVAKIIQHALTSGKIYFRVLVIGSPGIGKSVFGVLLFLLAIKEKRNVAYCPLDKKLIYYFTWNDNSSKYDISNDPNGHTKYEGYFDGNEEGALNLGVFKCAYLFSSPRTKNFKEFVKGYCYKIYMNPWSQQECQMVAKLIDCKETEWLPKFDCVGGKPSIIFSSKTCNELVKDVMSHIPDNIEAFQRLVKLLQRGVFGDNIPHVLFYFSRDSDASGFCLAYSSWFVHAVVSARYEIGSPHQSHSLLLTPTPDLQAWRDKAIERHLLAALATSSFDIKPLEQN